MTMTTKEKRLANSDIEISQHALVTFKFLSEFVFISSISVGRGKLQKDQHSSMMSLFAVLNNIYTRLIPDGLQAFRLLSLIRLRLVT